MHYKYLFDLGLFEEKRMIFKLGGPDKAPERAKTGQGKSGKVDLYSISELISDIDANLEDEAKKLKKIKPKNNEHKERILKAQFEIIKIKDRLKVIKKEIAIFLEKKEKATQAIIVKYDKALRRIYKERTGKEWERKAPAKKPKSEPSQNREKKEIAKSGPKQKLTQLLNQLLKINESTFNKASSQISKLVSRLNLKPIEGKTQILQLPGGFKIAYLKWKDYPDVRPSMMIFKGTRLICFKTEGRQFQYAHNLAQGESFSYTRRMAELVKSNIVLDKALAQIFMIAGNRLAFRTKGGLKNFQSALVNLARFTAPDKNSWHVHYPTAQADVSFRRVVGGHAFFTINTPHGTIYFYTRNKDYIGFPDIDKGKVKGVIYWKADDFNLTKAERIAVEKKEKEAKEKSAKKKMEREKAAREKAAHEKEEIAKKRMMEILRKEAKEKSAKKATMNKLLNPDFKNLVKFDKDNPQKFTLDAGKSSEAKRLINRTRIHELLNLKSLTDKEVRIKITGAKGVREGIYTPGDKTCYLVESGNKTKNRLKFYDKDTFEISMKPFKKEKK